MIIFGGEMIRHGRLKLIFILSILSILLLNTVSATDMTLNENDGSILNSEDCIILEGEAQPLAEEESNSIDNLMADSDDDFESIQKLIDNSKDGDSIYLENKTYKGNGTPINVNKNLTIYGYQYKNKINTILDAKSKSNIFNVNENIHLDIYGLSFINGNGSNGGAIYNKGTLNVYDSSFENITGNDGGAIYNEGILKIGKSNFKSNNGRYGGAIYNSKDLEISNSSFNRNSAFEGGAIYNIATAKIANSNFTSQKVSHKAGAIFSSGTLSIDNSTFYLTTGSDEGGAIFTSGGIANINSSKFLSNKAISYGGGIDNNGIMTIENSLFDRNSAYGAGAIDNGGDLTIINSNFTGNKATMNGGAIDNNQNLKIIGSTFENNTSGKEGGAVLARSDTYISHCSIINNADSKGYAIFSNEIPISLDNNWWGSNNPEFEKLINLDISDEFRWIIMNFTNITPLKQNSISSLMISFNQSKDKNNNLYALENPSKLADLKGNIILYGDNGTNSFKVNIDKGNLLKSISIKLENNVNATVDDQTISLSIMENTDEDSEDENSTDNDDSEPLPSDSNDTDSNPKSSDSENSHKSEDFSKQTNFNLKEFKIKDLTKSVQSQVINPKLDDDSNEEIDAGDDGNEIKSEDSISMNYLIPIAIAALILLILIAFKNRNDEDEN